MAVKIGHASIDENGKVSGGKAGDSTGKEVCTRQWYSKPWQYYLECTDNKIANIAATYMEEICSNNNVGYDQRERLTLYNQLKVHKDVSKLTPCECDCSSLIACCYIMAGLNINPSCTTRNIKSALLSTGKFISYSDSEHIINDKKAKRGGIFLKEGSHVVMALENGSFATNDISNSTLSSQVVSVINDLRGIDVSAYNVITDYNKVKNTGVQFAVLKIMRKDLQIDKLFATHLNGFKSCGIPIVGVYNYSYATTITKAKTDAQKVVNYLKQYGLNTTVYLDIEDDCQKNLGATLISIINAYQDVIESNGFQFGLYTGMSFYNSYIKPYKSSLKCNIEWIARYPSSASIKITDTVNLSKKPNIGTVIEGWQYSSTGVIDGINGKVDLNVFYGNKTSGSVTPPPSFTPETSIEFLGKINTKSGSLNIRSAPNSSSAKLGSYKKSELVYLISKTSTNWYKTDKGYIFGEYVIAAKGKVFNCSKLNIRKEPIAEGNNIVSVLNVNDEIYLTKIADNGWYQVKTKDNLVGYVSNKYITIL